MARSTDASYEISRPTGRCAATGHPIAIGQAFIAALAERDGQEGLERLDYSLEAWEAGARPELPLRLFGYWRSVMSPPGETKRQFIDDEALLDLFDGLAEATEPSRLAFRYVLALILVRKRLLRYEGGRRGVMLVRRAKRAGEEPDTSPPSEVIDPGMDDAAIAEATEQLGQIIQGETEVGA